MQTQKQQTPENPEGTATNSRDALQVSNGETEFYTNNNYSSEESSCIAEIVHSGVLGESTLSIISLISIISIVIIINIINIIRGHKDLIQL